MKKYLAAAVLMAGITWTACAHQKKGRKGTKSQPSITAITMSRGACFGRCPVYTLTIQKDGRAQFEGRQSTPFLGTYQKQYSAAAVSELFRRAAEYRVDTLQSSYVVSISDLPGLDFTFTINGKNRQVHNAGFGPRYLLNFGHYVDETVVVDSSWKKIRDLPKE